MKNHNMNQQLQIQFYREKGLLFNFLHQKFTFFCNTRLYCIRRNEKKLNLVSIYGLPEKLYINFDLT